MGGIGFDGGRGVSKKTVGCGGVASMPRLVSQ